MHVESERHAGPASHNWRQKAGPIARPPRIGSLSINVVTCERRLGLKPIGECRLEFCWCGQVLKQTLVTESDRKHAFPPPKLGKSLTGCRKQSYGEWRWGKWGERLSQLLLQRFQAFHGKPFSRISSCYLAIQLRSPSSSLGGQKSEQIIIWKPYCIWQSFFSAYHFLRDQLLVPCWGYCLLHPYSESSRIHLGYLEWIHTTTCCQSCRTLKKLEKKWRVLYDQFGVENYA